MTTSPEEDGSDGGAWTLHAAPELEEGEPGVVTAATAPVAGEEARATSGTRRGLLLATAAALRSAPPRRLDQYRSVDGSKPLPAAKSAAGWPLARHAATRSAQVFSVCVRSVDGLVGVTSERMPPTSRHI
jgi:hypothetical protein